MNKVYKILRTMLMIMLFFVLSFSQTNSVKNSINSIDSLHYDAKTGKMFKIKKTKKFDIYTGELIFKIDTVWNSIEKKSPVIIEEVAKKNIQNETMTFDPKTGSYVKKIDLPIISLAKMDVNKNFNKIPWMMFGGPATCGSIILAGSVGANIAGGLGFGGGVILSGIFIPKLLSKIPNNNPMIYPDNIPFNQREIYKTTYLKEMQKKREYSVYNGTIIGCAVSVAAILFIVASFTY